MQPSLRGLPPPLTTGNGEVGQSHINTQYLTIKGNNVGIKPVFSQDRCKILTSGSLANSDSLDSTRYFTMHNSFDMADLRKEQSVGEVMAIGRTFQESLQKALRGLEIGISGLDEIVDLNADDAKEKMQREMRHPGPDRLLYVADAFRSGMSLVEIYEVCKIDPWFLAQIEDLVITEQSLATKTLSTLKDGELYKLKRKGFSDIRIAKLLDASETEVRNVRHKQNIRPVYKRIDSCAAEFSSDTAYLYSTYEEECEANNRR